MCVVAATQGHPNKAEDFACSMDLSTFSAFSACPRACLAFVVDGHGGTEAVGFVAQRFPELLLQRLADLRSAPQATMTSALLEVDAELVRQGCSAGAVMCAMLLVDDTVSYVNTGDCRCAAANRVWQSARARVGVWQPRASGCGVGGDRMFRMQPAFAN